jgi:hypothetical protein
LGKKGREHQLRAVHLVLLRFIPRGLWVPATRRGWPRRQTNQRPSRISSRSGISFTSRQAWMRRGEMRNQRYGVRSRYDDGGDVLVRMAVQPHGG